MESLAQKFAAAKNYVLYYGSGKEKELGLFDVAIVEPMGQSQSPQLLSRNQGVLVLAYLSVMEIPSWAPEMKLLRSHDFIRHQYPVAVNQYGNNMVDLRSKRWENLLLHKAGTLLNLLGYDGVFLDTIGNVEWPGFEPSVRDSLILAAARLVRNLRMAFPNKIIVQNNGLERLCLLTAEYINGVCWENPEFVPPSDQCWVKAITHRLEFLKEKYGLVVLLLLEKFEQENQSLLIKKNAHYIKKISQQKGFLFYHAPKGYVNGIHYSEL